MVQEASGRLPAKAPPEPDAVAQVPREEIWPFDKRQVLEAPQGAVVKLVLSKTGKDAPGFVWAGIAGADEKWNTDRIYCCPILKERDRAVAYLPPGANIFRIFWTYGERLGYQEPSGHWEEGHFRIHYTAGGPASAAAAQMSMDAVNSCI